MTDLRGLALLPKEKESIPWDSEKMVILGEVPSVLIMDQRGCCQRCHSSFLWASYQLDDGSSYCPYCLTLGRCQTNTPLIICQLAPPSNRRLRTTSWSGTLMCQQKIGAKGILKSIYSREPALIHGVTGAGKTEMLFVGLAYSLRAGLMIAIVAPRVAVCLELYPRIKKVFPHAPISLLYGGEETVYDGISFVIATVQQLFGFRKWFDVIIVDEIDAYPLEGNPFLHRAIKGALRDTGVTIYLTATMTKSLVQEVGKGERSYQMVPLRFHRRPLPLPTCQLASQMLNVSRRLNWKFRQVLTKSLVTSQKLLIFCPSIKKVEGLLIKLVKAFPNVVIVASHSQDPLQEQKIKDMRQGKVEWFITTTILERGVTFPGIDVIVLEADHRVFNKAALIQIAGRAGRSPNHPAGKVWFFCQTYTRAIKECRKEIKKMNQAGQALLQEVGDDLSLLS